MTRTKKGKKPVGHDYWGKRGMCDKKTTKRSERTAERKSTRTVVEESIDKAKDRNLKYE